MKSQLHVLIHTGLYKQVGENLKFFHDSFESYFAARALESDFRAKRYDPIRECLVNDRLRETRQFLTEILEETDDAQKLGELLGGHAPVAH